MSRACKKRSRSRIGDSRKEFTSFGEIGAMNTPKFEENRSASWTYCLQLQNCMRTVTLQSPMKSFLRFTSSRSAVARNRRGTDRALVVGTPRTGARVESAERGDATAQGSRGTTNEESHGESPILLALSTGLAVTGGSAFILFGIGWILFSRIER